MDQCELIKTGPSSVSLGLQPEDIPFRHSTDLPSTVPDNKVTYEENRPKFGNLSGFLHEKRALQSIAKTPLSKSSQNPGKNSPARNRIKRGTVASLRSKFEGENGMNPKFQYTTSVKKVIGLKNTPLGQQRSAKKMTKLKTRNRVKSASFEVNQSIQSSILDYYGAKNDRVCAPGASLDDQDPNSN